MKIIDISNSMVFVTGAAGFIGANLTVRLLKDYPAIHVVGIVSGKPLVPALNSGRRSGLSY